MAYNDWMFPFFAIQTTSAISILPYYSGRGSYIHTRNIWARENDQQGSRNLQLTPNCHCHSMRDCTWLLWMVSAFLSAISSASDISTDGYGSNSHLQIRGLNPGLIMIYSMQCGTFE